MKKKTFFLHNKDQFGHILDDFGDPAAGGKSDIYFILFFTFFFGI